MISIFVTWLKYDLVDGMQVSIICGCGSASTWKVWSVEPRHAKHRTTRTDPVQAFWWRTDVVKSDFIIFHQHILAHSPHGKLLHLQRCCTVVPPVRCKLLSIHVMFSNMPRLLSSATGSLEDEMVLPSGEHSEHLEAHYLFLGTCDQSLAALYPCFFKEWCANHVGSGIFVWLSFRPWHERLGKTTFSCILMIKCPRSFGEDQDGCKYCCQL